MLAVEPSRAVAKLRGWATSRELRRRVLGPITADSLGLIVNLITGVLIARVLGTAGRGELAATLAVAQILGWTFSLGAAQAVSYHIARHPEDGGRVIGTWLAILVPAAGLAVLTGELLLPVLFESQSEEAFDHAQLFLLVLIGYVLLDLMYGVLAGDHDFSVFNILRFAAFACVALIYVVLWQLDELSVASALVANAVAVAAVTAAASVRALTRCGIGWPSATLARSTLSYAFRAHLSNVGGFMSARLDLMIIPAFFAASAVGLYSVATNVSSIIPTLTGAFAILVLPAAVRAGGAGVRMVVRSLQVALGLSLAIALVMAVLAEVALRLVYGDAFAEGASALRILLPGVVLDAGAAVLVSGLLAAGQPIRAAAATGLGAVLTVAGLLIVLPNGGIEGAAAVTTVAYGATFLATLFLYRRTERLAWRDFLIPPPASAEIAVGTDR
jgi:O-antigen/teichoic acid export membrane protein